MNCEVVKPKRSSVEHVFCVQLSGSDDSDSATEGPARASQEHRARTRRRRRVPVLREGSVEDGEVSSESEVSQQDSNT